MAGEKINLDLGSMMGEVGQTISIEDDGQVTAMEQNNSEDSEKQEEFKTGELVQLEDGSIVEYNSKKYKKKQKELEEETTEDTDDTEKNKNTKEARQEENKNPESDKDDISPYSPYAVALKDEGILPNLDIEAFNKLPKEEQVQALVDAYKEQIDGGVQSFIDSQPKVIHDILNGLKQSGEHVPLMNLIQTQSEIMELEGVTSEELEEDEALQEQLISLHLSESTNFSKEKIQKEITRLKASGELYEESVDAHKELLVTRTAEKAKQIAKAKEDKKVADETRKTYFETVDKTIDEVVELFPGTKVTPSQKKELKDFMTKPIAYTEDGRPVTKAMEVRSKNPMRFDMLLNHFIQLGFFGDKVDTSRVEQNAKSKSVKQLAEILENSTKFTEKGSGRTEDTNKEKPSAKAGMAAILNKNS